MSEYAPADALRTLNGRTFAYYAALEDAVRAEINAHLAEWPAHYGYRQLLDWACEHGWVIRRQDGSHVVRVPEQAG
jgi:hypothetical protein